MTRRHHHLLPILLLLLALARRSISSAFILIHSHSHRLSSYLASTVTSTHAAANIITPSSLEQGQQWAELFARSEQEGLFYTLFRGIREKSDSYMGIDGTPFHLTNEDITEMSHNKSSLQNFFTFDDLATALEEDFLDAQRGSTDNSKGWKVSAVSIPRGSSFEESRMKLSDVNLALEKGTVIFNCIGAHIPQLAGVTLACTDASSLPNAVNMYVTAAGKKTSAPPHTDRQDVVVVQTQGAKRWRVYSPPDPTLKPLSDMFARGKGDDNLPLHALEDKLGCRKLLDVTTKPGDFLFIPAGFPHTTDTVNEDDDLKPDTSIHLTFNLDTHVWDLDYLSARRYALMKAGVDDTALGQTGDADNKYIGNSNLIPSTIRNELFGCLPLGLLDEDEAGEAMVDEIVSELKRISQVVDQETFDAVQNISDSIWKETIIRIRQQGMELFHIHRDMYLAAIDEGDLRKQEEAMTSHLKDENSKPQVIMTQDRMQRLSLFRVQRYFEKIDASKRSLSEWSKQLHLSAASSSSSSSSLPANWEYTMSLKVNDSVEADLGGAFFPATVTKVSGDGSSYNVKFFDGEVEEGLSRDMIRLLVPPSSSSGNSSNDDAVNTSKMTKKEYKRWLKSQKKNSKI